MTTEMTTLIMENQNLIYSVANQFGKPELIEDLFQVGCLGMISAYQNYDPSYQVKFSTYAYPYIVGEMRKFTRENRGIKVSRELLKLQLKIEKASILLSQRLMREPTSRELSEFTQIPEYVISQAIHAKDPIKSMDEPIHNDNSLTLAEVIGKTENVDLNTLIALREELSKLDPTEKTLIQKRYMEDQTQSETAQVLGISQVQVSRKEQKVLTKLNRRLAS